MSFWHVICLRWLQDANSPALSGKVGVKRAGSVGGQQFAKVSLFLPWAKSFHNSDIFRWPRQECEVILAWRALGKLLSWFSNENSEKIIILAQPQKRKSLVFYLYHQQACSQFWDFVWQMFLWIYHNYICDLLMLRVTFRHDLYDKWYICIEQDVDASYRREWFH